MSNIQSKKIVFILMGVGIVGLTAYSMISERSIPSEFVALSSSVFGYYYGFGKGEQSNKQE